MMYFMIFLMMMFGGLAVVFALLFGPGLAFINVGRPDEMARIRELWRAGRETEAWATYWACSPSPDSGSWLPSIGAWVSGRCIDLGTSEPLSTHLEPSCRNLAWTT